MEIFTRFKKTISNANKIVISTHLYPDADGIGSQIALGMALKCMGKEAICVNQEKLLDRYRYLDPEGIVISYQEYQERKFNDIDLFIVVDTNDLERIGAQVRTIVENSRDLLFIDHHPAPEALSAIHCIDTKMAATGELVGHLIEKMGVPFSIDIALPLYTAIVIDTSSFRYPTVTGDTHRLSSKLLDTGVSPPTAYNLIYGTKKLTHMRLLGTLLSNAETNKNGKLAWMALTSTIMKKFHVDIEDTHSFINHLLVLDKIHVACMFFELGSKVKVSLRSSGITDVGILAQALGGGGHNYSAATIIEGKLEEVIPETIKKLTTMLDR